ncbi:MAG: nitrilase-related carbon-nitrogen hydrolase [Saprospiraceae bacterium]
MNITLFQWSTHWLNPSENLAEIASACETMHTETDLVVLPEMFTTGYVLNTKLLKLKWQEETIQQLTALAKKSGLTFMGSIPFFSSGRWFNTMVTISGEGLLHTYDKIHLFSPAGENKDYSSGGHSTHCLVEGWNIKPLICYDLRFPYLSFTKEQTGILIYSANWPESRIDHWASLLQARAIENQCYVIGVNRTGMDPNGYVYLGKSMVINYDGKILHELGELPSFDTCFLDKNGMSTYREKLPFFLDRKKKYF